MDQYFTKDYTGAPFVLFGAPHLISMALITAVCLSMLYFRNVWDENARRRFRYGLAIFLVIAELSWHIWSIYYGTWTIQTNLPFHLCSIFVWLCAVMLITKNYQIYEVAYFLGVGGALQAIITPDANKIGRAHV